MKRMSIIVVLLAISACGGGISGISIGGPRTPPPPPTNPGGIWEGSITDDDSGLASSIAGVITEIGVNAAAPEEGRFVDDQGFVFAQDPGGCVYNGSASVIYASYNAYRLRLTVSDCADSNGDYLGIGVLGDDV